MRHGRTASLKLRVILKDEKRLTGNRKLQARNIPKKRKKKETVLDRPSKYSAGTKKVVDGNSFTEAAFRDKTTESYSAQETKYIIVLIAFS